MKFKIRARAVAAILVSGFVLFNHSPVLAQNEDLVTITGEGTSEAVSSVEATREIQNTVMTETARAKVIELVGEKRYLKSKGIIDSKLIRQAVKFIPYVNLKPPVQQTDQSWKTTVEMKLSLTSLRKMILDAGILNDAEGPASILPLVAFSDRQKGTALRWWQGEPKDEQHKFLSLISHSFFDQMQAEFSKQGFHLIRPLETQISPFPEVYRVEHPASQDLAFMSEYYASPMVMQGDVRVKGSKDGGIALGVIRLQVIQVNSGRTVAEVSRQFETDPGNYEVSLRAKLNTVVPDLAKDLAVQVLEAWQRGTLNTNLIRITLNGILNAKQLAEFKAGVVQNIHEVKSMKERLFQQGQVAFEVDYAGEATPLTDHFKTLHIPGFETAISDATDKNITMTIKVR